MTPAARCPATGRRFLRSALSVLIHCQLLLFFACTQVEYDNPLDSRGTNYNPSGLELEVFGDDPLMLIAGDTYTDPGAAAWDRQGDDLTKHIHVNGTVDPATPDTYTVTYSVTDDLGNSVSKTRTVIVAPKQAQPAQDTTAPVLVVIGDNPDTIVLGESFDDPGVTATDDTDGDMSDSVSVAGTVDAASEGTYTLTYTVSDAAGNSASATREVTVVGTVNAAADTIPPTIVLKGDTMVTLAVGATFTDPGADAADNKDGDISGRVAVSGVVNTRKEGDYVLTYTVADAAGNQAQRTRTVRVGAGGPVQTDTQAPVITLNGDDPMTLSVGDTYTEPGASAVDDVDGDVSDEVTIGGTVITQEAGSYTVTYSVSDKAGNQSTATRTVVVEEEQASTDTEAPEITLKGDNPLTLRVGDTYTDPGARATDNVDGDISAGIQTTGTVNTATAGTYTVTYTVSDKAGNTDTAERSVTVKAVASGDLLETYGVPAAEPLPSQSNIQYTSITIEGTGGPSLSNIRDFTINWDAANKALHVFAFNTTDGNPDWYVPLHAKVTHTFDQAGPSFTLSGSGFSGLDGEYYITVTGSDLVWVSVEGSFAVVFTL